MDSESWENIHVQNGKLRAGLNFILIFFLSPVTPEADELEVGFKIAKNKSPKKGAILLFLWKHIHLQPLGGDQLLPRTDFSLNYSNCAHCVTYMLAEKSSIWSTDFPAACLFVYEPFTPTFPKLSEATTVTATTQKSPRRSPGFSESNCESQSQLKWKNPFEVTLFYISKCWQTWDYTRMLIFPITCAWVCECVFFCVCNQIQKGCEC